MPPASAFRHEALFYEGNADFVERTAEFVEDGVRAGERVLVAVPEPRLSLLRERLGDLAEQVEFRDMAEMGRNPARIIPAWQEFLDSAEDQRRPMRGIGEPIWSQRPDDELTECQLHESLINLAFDRDRPFRLLCPYDVSTLRPETLEEARRNHPYVCGEGGSQRCAEFAPPEDGSAFFAGSLASSGEVLEEMRFGAEDLAALRASVGRSADLISMDPQRKLDLILVVNELATNSIRHGGGTGILRMWVDGEAVVVELEDAGQITDPMVGRRRPDPSCVGGQGMWIVNQLADLVQIRTSPSGSIVRARLATGKNSGGSRRQPRRGPGTKRPRWGPARIFLRR